MISKGNYTHTFFQYQFLDFDIVLPLDNQWEKLGDEYYDLSVIHSQPPLTLRLLQNCKIKRF